MKEQIKKSHLWRSYTKFQNDRLLFETNFRPFSTAYKVRRSSRRTVFVMVYSLYGGGAERVACTLASGLADEYRVILIYLSEKGETYPLDPRVETILVPDFLEPAETNGQMQEKYIRVLKRRLQPVAAISLMFRMNGINVRTASGEAVICSERNNPARREPEHMEEIRSIYGQADHVVFQSSVVRGLFDERIRAHSTIIRNPVRVTCMRQPETAHRIVNIGRLNPQKNQAMLIRAFAAFAETHPAYTLSFYGDGDLQPALEALAEELGIRDRVLFHGNVTEIHKAVSDAEIFVLSSDYEGLSNALLECMMMGFPCISTRCEGSVDVITDRVNGLLTDIGDEAQLTQALSLLADDPAFREQLGKQAAVSAEAFRPEKIIQEWSCLIRQCSTEKRQDQ